jgi:hypothetical protein
MEFINLLADYTCGGNNSFVFDEKLPNTVSTIVTVIQIAVPILLIIFGMLDLGKAVMASKEDEIKKGQQTFIKRLIAALIVFFVVVVVKLAVSLVNSGESSNCIECFINGAERCDAVS